MFSTAISNWVITKLFQVHHLFCLFVFFKMKCNTIGSQLTPSKPCLGLGSETFKYVKNILDRLNNILCQSPFDNSESVKSGPLKVW